MLWQLTSSPQVVIVSQINIEENSSALLFMILNYGNLMLDPDLESEIAANSTYDENICSTTMSHCPLCDLYQHCKDGLLQINDRNVMLSSN